MKTKCYCGHTTRCDCGPETLEEAAERLATASPKIFKDGAKWQQEQYTTEEQHIGHTIDELDKEYIKGFNEGSNYYIERMYSEEQVKKISLDFFYHWWNSKGNNTEQGFNEWFEQFKNK